VNFTAVSFPCVRDGVIDAVDGAAIVILVEGTTTEATSFRGSDVEEIIGLACLFFDCHEGMLTGLSAKLLSELSAGRFNLFE